MPKIIENLKQRLIAEARRQIETDGYSAMTIRSVASGCGVGVGTVYNYFHSKDDLTAAFMLEDWQNCISVIQRASDQSDNHKPVVRCVYDQIHLYARKYQSVFRDASAARSFAVSSGRYHALLRCQIAGPLRKFCDSDFAAEFIAESLLTWTMAEKPFDEIYGMTEKLFKE